MGRSGLNHIATQLTHPARPPCIGLSRKEISFISIGGEISLQIGIDIGIYVPILDGNIAPEE